jgi:hypothetical protein
MQLETDSAASSPLKDRQRILPDKVFKLSEQRFLTSDVASSNKDSRRHNRILGDVV